ncbi:hypothetical protein L6452_40368 [Arctium lappa]|uniref:Uncharacterized protein n=1 Tax=Arctium lappa TaxID=4217 RepID=A0ACB8XMY0_ARCLA|nr:hypothetical protein L6452_40368 [Arctium lappa]
MRGRSTKLHYVERNLQAYEKQKYDLIEFKKAILKSFTEISTKFVTKSNEPEVRHLLDTHIFDIDGHITEIKEASEELCHQLKSRFETLVPLQVFINEKPFTKKLYDIMTSIDDNTKVVKKITCCQSKKRAASSLCSIEASHGKRKFDDSDLEGPNNQNEENENVTPANS